MSLMPVESDTRKLEACARVCGGGGETEKERDKECVNNGDAMCMC